MALSHVKSNPIADFTGTVTVFNSQGSTATVNATDIVRPSDWNSAHNIFQTISGNTAGSSTMSGTNLVFQGGNGITLSASTAAGAATIVISGSNQTNQTVASGNIVGSGFTTTTTGGSVPAGTLNSQGLSLAVPLWLTTQTVQTQASGAIAGSGFTSTTTAGAGVAGTHNSAGLSMGFPAWLTTAMASNAATISNVNISAGTTSTNASAFTFNNANGVTFGLGTGASAGSITASHNGLTSQSNQAFSAAGGSSAFQTLGFSDGGGVSFTNTNGSVGATVRTDYASSVHGHTLTVSAQSNTTQASSGTLNMAGLNIQGAGIVSVGVSNNSIVISATGGGGGGTAATLYATGNTTQSSTGTMPLSSMIVQGTGGVSAGISNGSIVVSGPSLTSLSATGALSASSNGSTISLGVGTVTVSATSNTTQGSSGTVNLNGLIFQGAGAASVGVSNGSIVISAPNAGAGNVTFSAGANSAGLASIVFSNSNGVSFGLNGSTITASAAGGGGGGVGVGVSTMGNTAGTTGTVTTGNVVLVGSGPISLSQSSSGSNATISINAPATSSLVGTGGISISTNGSTISVSYTGGVMNNFRAFEKGNNTTYSSLGQNTVQFQHFYPEDRLEFSYAELWARGSFVSSTNSQVYAQTISYGIYSQETGTNSTRMTLAGSSSMSLNVSYNSNTAYGFTVGNAATSFTSSSGGTGLATNISGPLHVYMPFSSTLQPNVKHAFALAISSATTVGTSPMRFAVLVQTVMNTLSMGRLYATGFVAPATSVIGDREMGVYTVTSGALPSSYGTANISIAVSRQQLPFMLEG